VKKAFLLLLLILIFSVFRAGGSTINLVSNFSFETPDPTNSNMAASWQNFGGPHARVHTFSVWDQNYVVELKAGQGAMQRITLNQTTAVPVRASAWIKGENIANDPNDPIGATFDAKVHYRDGVERWCPATPKTKSVGTFGWRWAGCNTMSIYPNPVPVDWIEIRVRMGNVPGTAWFDDVHVKEFPPTTSGMVTFRFDDSLLSTYTKAYPMLSARGFVGTEAVITSYVGADVGHRIDSTHMVVPELKDLRDHGWSFLSHTEHHLELSTVDLNTLNNELYWSHKWLIDNGLPTWGLALPKGGYNGLVITRAQAQWYNGYTYRSVTSSDKEPVNPQGVFPYNIYVKEINYTTTVQEVEGWLAKARSTKSWLVILLHEIDNPANNPYNISSATFNSMLNAVVASGLPVVNYDTGFAEITKNQ
jgi:peptidoglycan/xylan/chitin deacetylase (PgdA/CDA1 family)